MSSVELSIAIMLMTLLTVTGLRNYDSYTTSSAAMYAAQQMERGAVRLTKSEYCQLNTGAIDEAPVRTSQELLDAGYIDEPVKDIQGVTWTATFTDRGAPIVTVTSTNDLVLTTVASRKNGSVGSGSVSFRAIESIDLVDDSHQNALYKLEYNTLCGNSH